MAELFEQYAADFTQLVQSVRASLATKHASTDARRSALQNAESEVEEANDLLVQMEMEVRSFPQSVRDRFTGKLRELKAEYEKLHRDVKAQQPRASGMPMDGYADADVEADGAVSQRQRLLQGTSILEQGTERLAASTRLALETEDIGANILHDLQSQREQIEHSRDTQQKVVTVAIIVVLVLLILLILYAKL